MTARPLATILTICFVGLASLPIAATDDRAGDKPYLALGDSVPFGFMPQAGFEYVNAANFVGYPEYVGHGLRLTPVSASCPGETTASFLSAAGPDTGCRGYRAQLPLHVAYAGTQAAFALAFVRSNPHTRLVTLQLGANDLFLLQAACAGSAACIIAGLPGALAAIEQNIQTTIASLRAAGFRRPIVVVNYYPLDLNDAQTTAFTRALNDALADAAARAGARVADAFTPFAQAASTPSALGSACRAGLLKASPVNPAACDIHPSQSGHRLIARAIEEALDKGPDR